MYDINLTNLINDEKISNISLGEIFTIISNWINNLKNELNKLNYIETFLKKENSINIQQKDKQTLLYKLKNLIIETINIKKQIEDFSINYTNYSKYKNKNNANQIEEDEMVKYTLKDLDEKNKNILLKIKKFIDKNSLLKNYKENFNNQKMNFSKYNINKGKNKSLSITNIKNNSNNNVNKNGNLSERNVGGGFLNSNNYMDLDSDEKKIKIDILKDKIKNININFNQSSTNDTNEKTFNFNDKSCITPSNKYINEFKYKSFISNNEPNSTSNLLKDLVYNTSREKLLFKTKKFSFLKSNTQSNEATNNTNEKIISNQNFHIHNSCNNSSINLNIINTNKSNYINNNNNKIIPNNYKQRNQTQGNTNSIEINKKLNINPNIKKLKNNKILNFPLKGELFDHKTHIQKKHKKIIKFKKIKYNNIILKDKININLNNNTPKCIGLNNLLNAYNKILSSTRPLNKDKRSNSEYFLKPIKKESLLHNSHNSHNNINNNENSLRGLSLDNLNLKKFELQNKNTNIIKKSKPKIRNRAINIFNDNESVVVATPIRNMSFSFANKKERINTNYNDNSKIMFDFDCDYNFKEENMKLKKEIYLLKKEMESIKSFCNNLKDKVNKLEEENQILKEENKTILNLLNINKKKLK